jgi:hypothetical protein
MAVTNDGDRWEGEIFIPFANLDGVTAPAQGERWRLNCGVYEDAKDGRGVAPKIQWGYPDESEIEHGAVIVFGPPPERVLRP